MQRRFVAAVAQPVTDMAEAEPLVEASGRVPLQHLKIDAAPAALDGDRGESGHQSTADAPAACRLDDIQVFEIEAGLPEPGRKARVEQRDADRLAIEKGEDRLELRRLRAEAVAAQIVFGGDDRFGRPF